MVTSVDKPTAAPQTNEPEEMLREKSTATAGADRLTCPRCAAYLWFSYDEPHCLLCGFVDYRNGSAYSRKRAKSMAGTGSRSVVRYVGSSRSLAKKLIYVQLQRLRNHTVYAVDCPFCDTPMTQSSMSRKRKKPREVRYRCEAGHRISLTSVEDDNLGWM